MKKKIKPSNNLLKYVRYVEKLSLREMSELFKVSRETIRKWLLKVNEDKTGKDKEK